MKYTRFVIRAVTSHHMAVYPVTYRHVHGSPNWCLKFWGNFGTGMTSGCRSHLVNIER